MRWLNGLGYARCPKFWRAIEKYGWDSFDHIVIVDGVSEENARDLEKVLIAAFKTQSNEFGYNIADGGEGPSGMHHSEETRRKMSIAKSGVNHPNYGKHLSDETKRRISAANTGKHYGDHSPKSEETKRKISEGKMKPVCMCEDGNLDNVIKVFRSAKDAGEELGINRKNISLCCLGARPRAGGYAWKFA